MRVLLSRLSYMLKQTDIWCHVMKTTHLHMLCKSVCRCVVITVELELVQAELTGYFIFEIGLWSSRECFFFSGLFYFMILFMCNYNCYNNFFLWQSHFSYICYFVLYLDTRSVECMVCGERVETNVRLMILEWRD